MSVLAAAQAQLPLVKGDDGEIMTQQFLSVCKLVFPVIGEVGGGWTRERATRLVVFFFRFVVQPLATLNVGGDFEWSLCL